MLSINNNVPLHNDHREHAWALRTIGQNLSDLLLEYLEIEFTGQLYIARGRAQSKPQPSNGRKLRSELDQPFRHKIRSLNASRGYGNISHKSTGSDVGNIQSRSFSPFERSYPLYEIHRLDEQGMVQRKSDAQPPDIYLLSERLRTIGRMIEAQGGQLVRLTVENYRVTFTFRNSAGEFHHEDHSTPALYRSQRDDTARRGTGRPRDPWEKTVPANATANDTAIVPKFSFLTG
jgi:hypothetical protein